MRFKRFLVKEVELSDPYGIDPNDYIFVHAREDKNKPGIRTMEEIGFAVKNLNEFIDVVRSHNIHISVAAYPHLTQILPENIVRDGSGASRTLNRLFEKEIERLCKNKNVPFKSFYDEIKRDVLSGQKVFFEGDMHLNEYGLLRLGGYISQWILAYPKQTVGIELKEWDL